MSGSQVLILSGLEAVQNQIWFHPTRGSFHFIPQGACEKTVFQSLKNCFFCKGGFVWWVGPTEKEELQHLIPSLTRAVQKKEDFQIAIMLSSQCSAWPPQSPQKGFIPFHSTRGHSTKTEINKGKLQTFISPTMQCWKVAWLCCGNWNLRPALRGSMSPTNSASRFDRRGKRGKIYSKYPRLIE